MVSKARMFNKQASDPKNKPDQILQTLGLKQGQNVADIGSGGGYFSFRFAEAVGKQGHVFAVDTDSGKLDFVKKSADEKKLANVETVLVKDRLVLPEKVDLVFMRNVFHHIPSRVEYFVTLRGRLNPNGRVAIVEYNGRGGFSFHKVFGHYVNPNIIVEEMAKAEYRVAESLDFLSEQSFTIFSPEIKPA